MSHERGRRFFLPEILSREGYGDGHQYLALWVTGPVDLSATRRITDDCVRAIIDRAGLDWITDKPLPPLTFGLRAMRATRDAAAGVPIDENRRIRRAIEILIANLPPVIEWHEGQKPSLDSWSAERKAEQIGQYRAMAELAEAARYSFHDTQYPKALWHSDAIWLSLALAEMCSIGGKPLSFSARDDTFEPPDMVALASLLRLAGVRKAPPTTLRGAVKGRIDPGMMAADHPQPLYRAGWRIKLGPGIGSCTDCL